MAVPKHPVILSIGTKWHTWSFPYRFTHGWEEKFITLSLFLPTYWSLFPYNKLTSSISFGDRRALADEPVEVILFSWSIYTISRDRISHYNNDYKLKLPISVNSSKSGNRHFSSFTLCLVLCAWFCARHCCVLNVTLFFLHSRISRGNIRCINFFLFFF